MRDYRFICVLLSFIVILLSSKIGSAEANSIKNNDIVLTREKIVNQALNHYASIQQSQLQLRSQVAQLGYLQAQRNLEENSYKPLPPGLFPTTIEELASMVPDYEQLTEEQKQQVDSVLAIQSMINTSLNQYIDAQVKQQNAALLYQQQKNLKSIDEQLRAASFEVHTSAMEMERTKRLVQFNAFQSVYQIMQLNKNLEAAELEEAYLDQSYQDAHLLLEAGQLTTQEAEETLLQWRNQKKYVLELRGQLDFRIKLFKLDFGYKDDLKIIFPEEISEISLDEEAINSEIQLDKQVDIQKAVAAIKQAETNYDKTKQENSALANYYTSIISIETDNKALLERQLKKKIEELIVEEKSLLDQLDRLKEERNQLIGSKNDLKKLYLSGLVSGREVEAIDYKVANINLTIDKAQIEYEIWKEKKWAAIQGVLL